MSIIKRFTLIATLILLAACSAAPVSSLTANRQKWQAQNISHYRFHLFVGCFCGFRNEMPLTIEMRDGQVVSMLDNQGQSIIDNFDPLFEEYNSIDKLFDVLASAIKGGADKVTVEYNADHGYPQSVYIDYFEKAADDEMSFTVSDFEILE